MEISEKKAPKLVEALLFGAVRIELGVEPFTEEIHVVWVARCEHFDYRCSCMETYMQRQRILVLRNYRSKTKVRICQCLDPENLEGKRDSCWQLVFRFVTSIRASVLDGNA